MDNYDKFIGKLYDILINSDIISYEDKPKDLKEKKERLEKYLDKLDRVQNKALSKEEHVDTIKRLYYDKYVIKPENIPDSYFKALEGRYLAEGHGHHNLVNPDNEIDRQLKEEHINVIIREQKDSLDAWLDYFFSEDSDYLPMWAKVWAFQGMLNIGNLNKEKDGYGRRSNTSVNPFVSLDSEILGKCVELVSETFDNKEATDDEIDKMVSSGSFQKLYGKLLANKKQLKIDSNEGIWIKYSYETSEEAKQKLEKGIEPEYLKLYNSLQGYNTGWCTAGSKETAMSQVCGGSSYQGGDFYVYYTKDKNNEYKIPRIAIRMDQESIGEIRGVAANQNIESNMDSVLEEKLKEFPDGKSYQKKVQDMKRLTEIYNNYEKRDLTKEELIFLYETNEKIKGFGYKTDPRINEIKSKRNQRKDLTIIFNCNESEIGLTAADLCQNQLVYYQGDINRSQYDILKTLKYNLPQYIDGDLFLYSLTTAKGLTLPQHIGGGLWLNSLTTAEGLTLPHYVGGYLSLAGLTTAEGLIFPQYIGDGLYLDSLTTTEGLTLPQHIDGDLYLRSLTTAEGLTLPQHIGGYLSLAGLTTAKGLTLPQHIGNGLYFDNLTTAEGLTLPQYIYGDLDLSHLTTTKGLTLPHYVDGCLRLNGLATVEGLTLPQYIGDGLYLDSLTTADGLILPQHIDGDLNLSSLTTADGLILPQHIDGDLNLSALTTADGLILPQYIDGDLNLSSLTTADGLILPQHIDGDLFLDSLTTAKGLTLPQHIGGGLYLSGLTTAKGLTLPQHIGGNLYLSGLTTAKGLTLPQHVGGYLSLAGLTTADGLIFPQHIGDGLYFDSLTTTEGLTLPQHIDGVIIYKGNEYKLEQFIELQHNEVNGKIKAYKRNGFTTGIFTLAITIVITFIGIVIALLLLNR